MKSEAAAEEGVLMRMGVVGPEHLRFRERWVIGEGKGKGGRIE